MLLFFGLAAVAHGGPAVLSRQQAALLEMLLDLLAVFMQRHGFRMKYFITRSQAMPSALQLLTFSPRH